MALLAYMSSYLMSHDHNAIVRATTLFGCSKPTELKMFSMSDRAHQLYGVGVNPTSGAVFGIECNSDISRANRLFSAERARSNRAKAPGAKHVKSARQPKKPHTNLHAKQSKKKDSLKAMWDAWNTTMSPKHKKNKGTSFVVTSNDINEYGDCNHHVTVECIEHGTIKSRCTFQISLAAGNDIAIITSIDPVITNHSFVNMNYVKKYIHDYTWQTKKKLIKHVHVCSLENHREFWTQNGFKSTDHVDSHTKKHFMVFELKDDRDCRKQ